MYKQEVENIKTEVIPSLEYFNVVDEINKTTLTGDPAIGNRDGDDGDELTQSNVGLYLLPQRTVDTFIRGILQEQDLNRIDLASSLETRTVISLRKTLLRLTVALDDLIRSSIPFTIMPMLWHAPQQTVGHFIGQFLHTNQLSLLLISPILSNRGTMIKAILETTTMLHILYFEGLHVAHLALPPNLYASHP